MFAATLLASALVRAPTPALKNVVPRIAPPVCALDIDQNVLFGVGAAIALGAAAFSTAEGRRRADASPRPSQPASSPSSPAGAVPAWAAPQPKSRWPSKGGGGGVHRMAGRVYPPPVRELWYEPVGGTTGPHRMAGRLPPPPKPVIEYTPPTSTFRVTTSRRATSTPSGGRCRARRSGRRSAAVAATTEWRVAGRRRRGRRSRRGGRAGGRRAARRRAGRRRGAEGAEERPRQAGDHWAVGDPGVPVGGDAGGRGRRLVVRLGSPPLLRRGGGGAAAGAEAGEKDVGRARRHSVVPVVGGGEAGRRAGRLVVRQREAAVREKSFKLLRYELVCAWKTLITRVDHSARGVARHGHRSARQLRCSLRRSSLRRRSCLRAGPAARRAARVAPPTCALDAAACAPESARAAGRAVAGVGRWLARMRLQQQKDESPSPPPSPSPSPSPAAASSPPPPPAVAAEVRAVAVQGGGTCTAWRAASRRRRVNPATSLSAARRPAPHGRQAAAEAEAGDRVHAAEAVQAARRSEGGLPLQYHPQGARQGEVAVARRKRRLPSHERQLAAAERGRAGRRRHRAGRRHVDGDQLVRLRQGLGGAAAAPAPKPPASSVVSWYDSGKRLSAPSMVASWYDSGKRL